MTRAKKKRGKRLDPAALRDIARVVLRVARPERVLLFGSAARGDKGPDSDVDLLVVKSRVRNRTLLAQRVYMALFDLGRPVPVDIVVVTPAEVEKFRDAVGPIIRPALEEGIDVYAA